MRTLYFTQIAWGRLCFGIKQPFYQIHLFFSSCRQKSNPLHRNMDKKCPASSPDAKMPDKETAGDIPMKANPGGFTISKNNDGQQFEKKKNMMAVVEKRNPGKNKIRKSSIIDKDKYIEVFLSQPAIRPRRQRTMLFDDELYDRVYNLIKVPGGISFSNFMFNLVKHHFETYKDEINDRLHSIAKNIYDKSE